MPILEGLAWKTCQWLTNHSHPVLCWRIEIEERWHQLANRILKSRNNQIRSALSAWWFVMLLINFAAIHSTTMVCCKWSSRFQYLLSLGIHTCIIWSGYTSRICTAHEDEVEAVIREEGWSKVQLVGWGNSIASLKNHFGYQFILMYVFSFHHFLSQFTVHPVVMRRKVMRDFTFSNGVTIPAGNTVAASAITNVDPVRYSQSQSVSQLMYECRNIMPMQPSFDGFRFEKMRKWRRNGAQTPGHILGSQLYTIRSWSSRVVNPVVSSQSWSWIDVHQPWPVLRR